MQFRSQGQPLSMAYMDVHPAQPNGKTIVLLHGKNFCGATWEDTIRPLRDAGYRLVVPDQIGFCKSTKPQAYQFSLHQLALNTRALLASIGVEKPIIMGHSMGGMLAMRYVISFPGETSGLVLVNPIGLEDWKAKGVPFAPIDQLYEREQKTSFETIKQYQQSTYYAGEWKPEYDRWVNMLVGMYRGAGGRLVAWDQALTSDMIFTQPVVYELELISVPTLLMIGLKDTTAIGKDRAPPEIAKTLGNYPDLGLGGAAAHQERHPGVVPRARPRAAPAGPRSLQQGPDRPARPAAVRPLLHAGAPTRHPGSRGTGRDVAGTRDSGRAGPIAMQASRPG